MAKITEYDLLQQLVDGDLFIAVDSFESITKSTQAVSLKNYILGETGSVDYYIACTSGSNSNDGLSEDSPFLQISEVNNRLKLTHGHVRVHLIEPGNYEVSGSVFEHRLERGFIGIIGHSIEVLHSGTTTGGSVITLNDSSANFGTDNKLVGATLEMISGPLSGSRKTIQDHDNNLLTLGVKQVSAITGGMDYRIFKPTTYLSASTDVQIHHGNGQYPFKVFDDGGPIIDRGFYLENVGFIFDSFYSLGAKNTTILMYGCYVTGSFFVMGGSPAAGTYFLAGADNGPLFDAKAITPFLLNRASDDVKYVGWGIGCGIGNKTFLNRSNSTLHICSAGEISCFGGRNALYNMRATELAVFGGVASGQAELRVSRMFGNGQSYVYGTVQSAVSPCIINLNHTKIHSSASVGIWVYKGGELEVDPTSAIFSASVGISVETQGRARISGISISATSHDLEVGNIPVTGSLADIPNAGDFLDGGDSFITRV